MGNNAYALNALHINFTKRVNFILISEKLFSILYLDEIRAIIGHEIAHFKRYIPIRNRVYFSYYILAVLLSYTISAPVEKTISTSNTTAYFIVFLFLKVIAFLWNKFTDLFIHDIEYLSDIYSARRYGKLNMINALIKLFRVELLDLISSIEICRFVKSSKVLRTDDIGMIIEEVEKELDENYYTGKDLSERIKQILNEINLENRKPLPWYSLIKRDFFLNKIIKTINSNLNYRNIKWEELDKNMDGVIDDSEYEGFINKIRNNPELQIFEIPMDNISKMRFKSHPTLRERILFLDKHL